jgi:hypothetical protein
MGCKPMHFKVLATVMCFSIMFATASFTFAETVAAAPIGSIVTKGSAQIGNSSAPTGTTVFSGDKVSSTEPALINFKNGSRIEMTKAAATFNRQGDLLVVKTDQGLLRFNFDKGEKVLIEAGKFQITGSKDSKHVGVLGLNKDGEIAVTLSEGTLSALNVATGVRTEISPSVPMTVLNPNSPASAAVASASPVAVAGLAPLFVIGATAAAVATAVAIQQTGETKSGF